MKVLVAIKRVADGNAPIHILPDGSAVDLARTPMRINPFDEAALEWAVQEKEAGRVSEIVAVSLGDNACQDTLRHALALGADRAIYIDYSQPTSPLFIARQLQVLVMQENPALVLLGKQSSDQGRAQIGPMLAALLNWPQGLFASHITQQDGHLIVTREIEGTQEQVRLPLPALISADLRLAIPRFLKLQQLLHAKKKTITVLPATLAAPDHPPALTLLSVSAPPARPPARRTRSAAELITWLQQEGLQGEQRSASASCTLQSTTGHALILAEHDKESLHPSLAHLVCAAQMLAERVSIVLAGRELNHIAQQAAMLNGVSQVLLVSDEKLQHPCAEQLAPLLSHILSAQCANVLIAAATPFGKAILPRAAALLDSEMCSDVVAIHAPDHFICPIHAGEALAHVKNTSSIKILSVRASAFPRAQKNHTPAPILTWHSTPIHAPQTWLGITPADTSRPALTEAKIIVSGGNGLQSAEKFQAVLGPLADALHAALGATLAAIDAGFISNDHQIGQTGATVAPDFYFAIGLSGAAQHLAGMRDSRIIVALNSDPQAPICQHADYVLEGDLFERVPELIHALQASK